MENLSHIQIRTPKDDETPIDAAVQIFSSLLPSHISLWKRLYVRPKTYSFEIFLISQMIYFYVTTPQDHEPYVRSLISASYPLSKLQKTTDPMEIILKSPNVAVGEMVLNSYFYLPIKTFADFSNVDPLNSLVGLLSKQDESLKICIQLIVTPTWYKWQDKVLAAAQKDVTNPLTGATQSVANPNANKSMIAKKAQFQGGRAALRLIVSTNNKTAVLMPFLQNLAGTYGGLSSGEGNQFVFKKPLFWRDKLLQRVKERKLTFFERGNQILNAQELATLWHPTGLQTASIRNIAWGKTLKGEPPENLPIASASLTDEQKKDINFFATTDFKNKDTIFGIKSIDRGKHVYIMGKTGSGKSTLIANMAIDDIRKDRGIGIIDPHGDLCETVVHYIPKRRINDVIYLEPFDTERPFSLNILQTSHPEHKHLIASGIVSIFSKLYANSWGPRLEYILRNVVLTLIEMPNATLADVLPLLAQDRFRAKAIQSITDPVIKAFWEKEFDVMPPRMKAEAISPIQNKVGQFVQSRMIRNIIGHTKSTINLEDIMDNKKILLLNLSQGKLGEDNASLLGAMVITQIQLTAMRRAYMDEKDRQPFFLYVDEFQNFATSSFLKILSEARKYRLSLTLANQYIDQLEEEIQRAIFGNVGTLMTFVVGARDATMLAKEFAGLYTDNDLVSIGKFEIILKLSIDFMTSFPFPAKTLPLPSVKNENREKILRVSKEKYGRKVTDVTVQSQYADSAGDENKITTDQKPSQKPASQAPRSQPPAQKKPPMQAKPNVAPRQEPSQSPTQKPEYAPPLILQKQQPAQNKPMQSPRPVSSGDKPKNPQMPQNPGPAQNQQKKPPIISQTTSAPDSTQTSKT